MREIPNNSSDKFITFGILFSGVFQLSFVGLIPDGYKFIGDFILLLTLVVGFNKGLLKPRQNKSLKITFFISLLFLIYTILLILYSSFQWKEFYSSLLWARRWLIAGCYFIIFSTCLIEKVDAKIILIGLKVLAIMTCLLVFLERNVGIHIVGVSTSHEYQGGILLTKTFIPGNFILLVVSVYYCIRFFEKSSIVNFLLMSLSISSFLYFINFRSWWVSLFFCIFSGFFLFVFYKFKNKLTYYYFIKIYFGTFIVSVLSILFIYLGQENILIQNDRINWVLSTIGELTGQHGNMETRYNNDASRLNFIWNNSNDYFKLLGIGFVALNSRGYYQLGFTSESNDSGWVEVLLTGGVIGAVLLFLIWIANVIRLHLELKLRYSLEKLSVLLIWVISLPLMISSNLLLWDFGFVPISWMYIISVNRPTEFRYKNKNIKVIKI